MLEQYGVAWKYECEHCGTSYISQTEDVKKWSYCPYCGGKINGNIMDSPYTIDNIKNEIVNDISMLVSSIKSDLLYDDNDRLTSFDPQYAQIAESLSKTYRNLGGDK